MLYAGLVTPKYDRVNERQTASVIDRLLLLKYS